jgi:hypothetical protein
MPEMTFDDDDTLVDEGADTEMSLDEVRAARLLEATNDFITALLMISEAAGVDDPDDFQRACNVIERQHRIACNALLVYGFQPRRMTILVQRAP